MNKLICLLRGHDWRKSQFKALNSTTFGPDFICARCRKFKEAAR